MNDYTGRRLFDSWYIPDFAKPIGRGSFGTVYELRSYNAVIDPTAVKIISIPSSKQEYEAMLSAVGTSEEDVNAKLTETKDRLLNEIAIMLKVSGHSNCVSCMAYCVVPHEDCFGWDVLIQMEKLESLDAYYRRKGVITNNDIIKLGMDMCSALEACQANNIIHRDIKPANIMVREMGEAVYYKLADFGVARILRGSGTMTITGTMEYMAPELLLGEGDARVDIYSLGIVLYELLNANRLPFVPDYPAPYTENDAAAARARRLKGERVAEPIYAVGTELGRTIVKACEYRPEDRFENAAAMRDALAKARAEGVEREIFTVPPVGRYKPTQREEKETDKPEKKIPKESEKPAETPVDKKKEEKAAAKEAKAKERELKKQKAKEKKSAPDAEGEGAPKKKRDSKKLLLLVIPIVLVIAAAVMFTISGPIYKVSGGHVLVTGYKGFPISITIASEYNNKPVTEISIGAFRGCWSLTSVEIPSSVTKIGSYAFKGTNLKTVTIPSGVEEIASCTFENCSRLSSVKIPNTVTVIKNSAFNGSGLESLTIPGSVKEIESNAFEDCAKLQSATLSEGVTTIGNYAFKNCTALTSIAIPSSAQYLGEYAFKACSSLARASISGTNLTIEEYVFYGCASLAEVKILSGVTEIGSNAFYQCTSLSSVEISDGLKTIGEDAFYNCEVLTALEIPGSVESIGNQAFAKCYKLKAVTIPGSVETIGYYAFAWCEALESVIIEEGVTDIGENAFAYCTALREVTIPDSLESLGDRCFFECESLEAVEIPSTIDLYLIASPFPTETTVTKRATNEETE